MMNLPQELLQGGPAQLNNNLIPQDLSMEGEIDHSDLRDPEEPALPDETVGQPNFQFQSNMKPTDYRREYPEVSPYRH